VAETALPKQARHALDHVAAQFVAGPAAVAVGVVVVGRDDEGRVGHDQVEALAGDRIEQVAFDELDVRRIVEGRVEATECERPGVGVGGSHAPGVPRRQQGLDPAPRAHVGRGRRRTADRQVRERPRRGGDAHDHVAAQASWVGRDVGRDAKRPDRDDSDRRRRGVAVDLQQMHRSRVGEVEGCEDRGRVGAGDGDVGNEQTDERGQRPARGERP
jgi:hypothetical protein